RTGVCWRLPARWKHCSRPDRFRVAKERGRRACRRPLFHWRCGWGSAQDWQLDYVVAVRNATAEDRIPDLELEAACRADAAAGSERAAEHDSIVRQAFRAIAAHHVFRREHRIHRAFLVEQALATDYGPGAQNQLVPMVLHVIEGPELRRHRLFTHLLGYRDVEGLGLAVGMV